MNVAHDEAAYHARDVLHVASDDVLVAPHGDVVFHDHVCHDDDVHVRDHVSRDDDLLRGHVNRDDDGRTKTHHHMPILLQNVLDESKYKFSFLQLLQRLIPSQYK